MAQSNFKPGYIVNLKGDTVHGFIDYREWDKNPRQISFKAAISSDAEQYTCKKMNAFAVTGSDHYEKHIVAVSTDEIDLNKVNARLDTGYKTDTVFLRVIDKGNKLTLYTFRDDLKTRFYLSEAGSDQPFELVYHVYLNADLSSANYITRYRTQLQYEAEKLGASNNKLADFITSARYDPDDLSKIVSQINGNSSGRPGSEQRSGIRWFAGLKADYNQLKPEDIIAGPGAKGIFPEGVAGIDFMPNKNVQLIVLRGEIGFTGAHYAFSNQTPNQPAYSSSLTQYTLSAAPQMLFNFYNTDNLKVFIDGGLSFNFSHYSNYGFTYNYGNFGNVSFKNYPPLAKVWVSIPLKAGVVINKKIEIFGGYVPLTNLSTIPDSPVTITTHRVGLNYFFGSK
ncbi:MAG TPA: hypothetical protein VHC47_13080 [Mucilaginibacter sp.]|nr:hypothetical protein [Mucilaginibacter sp.]